MPPTGQPKHRAGTTARRQEILKAAMEVFGSKGYANGTLIDIAEIVGMTHSGILHHFGSKDQLLLEVLTYRDQTDVADLETQQIPGGVEIFRHLIRTAFANAKRAGIVQAFAVLSAESVTDDHPARSYFEGRYQTLRTEISDAFRIVCQQRGIETDERVMYAAAAILAVMDGLQIQWLLHPDRIDLGPATEFGIIAIAESILGPLDG